MRKSNFVSGLTAACALGVALAGVGCKKEASCDNTYKMLKECEKEFDMDKDKFLERCDKDKDEPEAKAMIGCSTAGSCDEFQSCAKKASEERIAARKAKRVQEDVEKLEKQLADKNFKEARWTCESLKEDLAEGTPARKTCDELPKQALAALQTVLTGLRDAAEDDKEYKCFELKDFAKAISPEEAKKAETLCDEVNAAAKVKEALDEAKKNLEAKTLEIPFGCGYVIETYLEKLGTDWAKKATESLVKTCFVDLGKVVLAAKVPEMKWCDHHVKKVVLAVTKHGVQDAELAPWVEKAKPLCEKED